MPEHRFRLPESELSWRFSRSSGPGGQHVDTADTRAEALWSPADSAVLTEDEKQRVIARLRSRLVDGRLSAVASSHRSQLRNRAEAVRRLEDLVAEALRPRRRRRPAAPSRASIERQRQAKARRSELKRDRAWRP